MRVDRRPAQAERPQQRSQEPPRAPDPEDPAGSVATGINQSFMIHLTSVPSVGAVDHPSSVGRPLPIPFKKKKRSCRIDPNSSDSTVYHPLARSLHRSHRSKRFQIQVALL